jgi:predicted amidophosphoribosyltransferase
MFDVCTTGDTVHIDKIFKLLPHADAYRIDVCRVTRGAHNENL